MQSITELEQELREINEELASGFAGPFRTLYLWWRRHDVKSELARARAMGE